MRKPAKSIIASARVLIRRPSEQKLPTEDLRLLLHQSLDELNQFILKENQDYFTHELEVGLTYDAELRGYTLDISTEQVNLQPTGIEPVFFLCQLTTEDQQTGQWQKVKVVKYATLMDDSARMENPIASYVGNDWQGFSGSNFKFNLTDDFIAERRWRLAFRYFPQEVLDLDETVPFPSEFTSVLEHLLAAKSLSLVRDDSPTWKAFTMHRIIELETAVGRGKAALVDWLNRHVENDYVTPMPYHYRNNNPLISRSRRIRAQW